ncbi:MAG: hypothetical protein E4H14_16860 [Candidatus Thorarchaeota archaeon]|nr:MAG: hypothetical protein E4H14_16860 [Candidatus Thorarchaeota archaeon]
MKVFETPDYSHEELTKYFEGQIKTEGIISKRNLETFEGIRDFYRPFRKITMIMESPLNSEEKISTSYVDEQLSSIINDSSHRFLLWRPRYANLSVLDADSSIGEYSMSDNSEAVKRMVDDMILQRWNGQELDEELRPKLRDLQADPLSAIALIIPRSPHGLRREETILAERKETHAYVLASSLVTNCSSKDIMVSAEIGERVSVRTILAEYHDISNDNKRLLFLETPGSDSLRDAQKSGYALTRIYDLYPDGKYSFS